MQVAPGYGASLIRVHGPTGSCVWASTPSAKMSSGPCPSTLCAIGAATNAARKRKTMNPRLMSASLSRLKRIQTSSQ